MSNYPDDMNWNAYDRTIGAEQSVAEQVYEAHCHHVNTACSRAWQEYPTTNTATASERWTIVAHALLQAGDAMKKAGVYPNKQDVAEMAGELDRARDANSDGSIEAFKQCIGSYMNVFSRAIERQEQAA